jgi:hypothetical protein
MVYEIYSHANALSLCTLAMTCKKMMTRRPHEKDLEMALNLRTRERLLEKLDKYQNGLGVALTSVLREGEIYMAGEFLFNCLLRSTEVNTLDIIIKASVRNNDRLDTLSIMHNALLRMRKALRKQSLDLYLDSEHEPSVELKCMGVLRCCLINAWDLKIRVILMNSYDVFENKDLAIQGMLKKYYKFSLFECCYDGSSLDVNNMADKLKKIGKTRHHIFERRLRDMEHQYDEFEDLYDDDTLKEMEEDNNRLIALVRSSLSATSDRYKELGYHIKDE